MLKRGIVSYDQLQRPLTWLGKKRHASVLLLGDLFRQSAPDGRHYDTIISQVITPNGTWKESCADRFAALDRLIFAALVDRWPAKKRLTVADLGVSSGVTSVQLYQLLRERFSVDFLATDLYRDAIAVRSVRGGWVVVFDADGRELQHVLGGFVLPGQGHESAFYPINRVMRALSRRFFGARAAAIFARYDASGRADFDVATIDGHEITKLPLLSLDCLRLARQSADFRFEVADIMHPLRRPSDVVRAMNVLTPVYFDEARLRTGIAHCISALNPGGLLILGRSPIEEPRAVKATIYHEDGGVLHVLRRLNGGYEADHLIESARAAA